MVPKKPAPLLAMIKLRQLSGADHPDNASVTPKMTSGPSSLVKFSLSITKATVPANAVPITNPAIPDFRFCRSIFAGARESTKNDRTTETTKTGPAQKLD